METAVLGSVEFESGMLILEFVSGYQNACDFVKAGDTICLYESKQKEE